MHGANMEVRVQLGWCWFSPPTLWVSGIKLRSAGSQGLVTSFNFTWLSAQECSGWALRWVCGQISFSLLF